MNRWMQGIAGAVVAATLSGCVVYPAGYYRHERYERYDRPPSRHHHPGYYRHGAADTGVGPVLSATSAATATTAETAPSGSFAAGAAAEATPLP